MGKRKSALLSYMSLLFVFVLTTIFMYLVYNRHYDSASSNYTVISVLDYESDPFDHSKQDLGTLREDLSTWAADHHTVIFYNAFSAAGIAAVDYTGWFQQTFDTSFDGQESKTALVRDASEYLDSYVFEDVLFPGVYNYQIIDSFDDRHAPEFQGDAFFYFPLADITSMQGLLYTTSRDADDLNELISIVEKTGRVAAFQTYDGASLNGFEVFLSMLFGDEISSSILFAFLGLVSCAVFALYMMYRESNRYLSVHHLYGAPYHSLFLSVLVKLISQVLVSPGL